MTKHIYESPQLEVIEAKLETCILSNGENLNNRTYGYGAGESVEDFWK